MVNVLEKIQLTVEWKDIVKVANKKGDEFQSELDSLNVCLKLSGFLNIREGNIFSTIYDKSSLHSVFSLVDDDNEIKTLFENSMEKLAPLVDEIIMEFRDKVGVKPILSYYLSTDFVGDDFPYFYIKGSDLLQFNSIGNQLTELGITLNNYDWG